MHCVVDAEQADGRPASGIEGYATSQGDVANLAEIAYQSPKDAVAAAPGIQAK
ncbi:hypothetical protein LP420_04200 [Massilia sp. B-10]|nr:hypothetical protein LP420_04200 [Massilia sp. B-10]